VLDAREMAAFFANLDVLVVPSLNSTESFGLVQVEGMLCGHPGHRQRSLPGVRQPGRADRHGRNRFRSAMRSRSPTRSCASRDGAWTM
jgi:hypothetical protein